MLLSERDRNWSERWRNQAIAGSGSANQLAVDAMRREERGSEAAGQKGDGTSTDGQFLQLLLIVIGMVALVAFVYLRHTLISIWSEYRVELFAFGALGLLSLAGLGYLLHRTGIVGALSRSRFFSGSPEPMFYDPDQVRLRVSGAAFRLEVQLYALLGDSRARTEVIERVLRPVVASYRRFDSPVGARFEAGPMERLRGFDPDTDDMGFLGGRRRLLRQATVGQGVVGTRAAAAFWHVPGDAVDVPGLARAGSRRLPVPQEMFAPDEGGRDGAALIGVEAYGDGGLRKLHIPPEAMRRSGLIVARTGMGKTTLTQHIARSLLRDRATGAGTAALAVVDPHSDLVLDILNGLPVGAAADVRLVDLGDGTHACGLNLLDTRTFPERDLTVETVLTVARSSSRNWGDRMEEILRWTLYALYEANRHREANEQYTIYDGIMFLTDESRRREIVREGRDREQGDVTVAQWWHEIYPLLLPANDRLALAPVLRKLGQQERAQGPGTAPHNAGHSGHHPFRQGPAGELGESADGSRGVVHSGRGDTQPAELSRQAAGSSPTGRAQVSRRHRGRDAGVPRGAVRGDALRASEVRRQPADGHAEPGQAERDDGEREYGETILANLGSLFSFQVNASDAELLHRELESDVIEDNDIVELPPHHCYGRLTLESGNIHFSMEVLPPMPGNKGIAELIRQASDAYTRPIAEVDAENAAYMRGKYREYFGDPEDDHPIGGTGE